MARGHEVTQSYAFIEALGHILRAKDAETVDSALRIIRNGRATISDKYWARKTMERLSRSVETKDAFRIERNNVAYNSPHFDGTVEGALRAVEKREECVFYDFLASKELERVARVSPDVLGISVCDERQLIPGLILGSLVRDRLTQIKVILGGNLWARLAHAFHLPGFAELLRRTCDGIVQAEGFLPMDALTQGSHPADVPGLVWRDKGGVVVNRNQTTPVNFNDLPSPIFLDGVRQWAPEKVVPLYTSSNCEKRCGFCAISAGSDTFLVRQRVMDAKHVARDMIASGAHRFDFTDELLSVVRQIEIGKELRMAGHDATWQCYLTVTRDLLDLARCQELANAGCRAVQLGLESLDPETLTREKKGWNGPEGYGTILRNLRFVGIQTHVFIILGIPGERTEVTLQWPAFLKKHGNDITTIKSSRYRLTRMSPEETFLSHGRDPMTTRDMRHLALIELQPDTQPLKLNRQFHYRPESDISNKRVDALRDLMEEACRRHWGYEITSTLPWWANRGHYTAKELEAMSRELPPPDHVDLESAWPKIRTMIRESPDAKLIPDNGGLSFESLEGGI
ncbi:MAG: hypothetical protein Q8P56_03685 [Candidatus Uhrbacteria bacterium]|nr:hypothetical protein [Candidatus Uhrbacteria bacterium]